MSGGNSKSELCGSRSRHVLRSQCKPFGGRSCSLEGLDYRRRTVQGMTIDLVGASKYCSRLKMMPQVTQATCPHCLGVRTTSCHATSLVQLRFGCPVLCRRVRNVAVKVQYLPVWWASQFLCTVRFVVSRPHGSGKGDSFLARNVTEHDEGI